MKRLLIGCLVLTLVFTAVACAPKKNDTATTTTAATTITTDATFIHLGTGSGLGGLGSAQLGLLLTC